MAIQHDASSGAFSVDGGSGVFNWQIGISHTPVGTPVVALVQVMYCVDALSSGNVSLDSVTYGGVAMTLLASGSVGSSMLFYALLNPPAGPQVVFLNFSNDDGATDIKGFANCTTLASSLGGTALLATPVAASGSSTVMTQNVTGTSANNLWLHQYGIGTGSAFVTATVVGTGETRRAGNANFGDGVTFQRGQFNVTTQLSLAGTVTPKINLSLSRSWRIISIEVQEVPPVSGVHLGGYTSYDLALTVPDVSNPVTQEEGNRMQNDYRFRKPY